MKQISFFRLCTGASATALAATTIAVAGPAHAAAQPMFSYSQGWRVDQHVRELADLNGDARADVVGFGDPGVFVAYGQADGSFSAPVLKIRDFGTAQGWSNQRHVRTAADVDGDGRDDLVGFGNAGVHVSYAQPDGSFTEPELEVRDFGWNQGWRVGQHPRELVDLTQDGTADVVGFGHSGINVSYAQTNRTIQYSERKSDGFGWNQGWRTDKHLREVVDVSGDGFPDIVGFGDAGVYVAPFQAGGGYYPPADLRIRDFGYVQGWRIDQHPRELADVNGDGSADVVGFGNAGTYVAYNGGVGAFSDAALKVDNFGRAQGWRGDQHVRTLADVNGDAIGDVVGFATSGTHAAHGRPDSTFDPVYRLVDDYGSLSGWTEERYPRLLGDVNGDGRDDVVGFGHSATYVTVS